MSIRAHFVNTCIVNVDTELVLDLKFVDLDLD